MGRFNLLDEPWISVLVDKTGEKKDVSMLEFFLNTGSYHSLAGEMATQNFAVMRFLLSVIQTVFSRFDYQGNVLEGIILDERWRQTEDVDEDDIEDYGLAASECWKQLYSNGAFPDVVFNYLEKWRDRFYLFDEEYPFYQVNKKEMDEIMSKISQRNKPTPIYGKNLNRTISESENKTALFSPIVNTETGKRSVKDIMTAAQLVKWLLMFQGYTGQADKVSLTKDGQKSSKGWLFDLGGIFLQGNNMFETLVMNFMPESPTDNPMFSGRIQKPCWEAGGSAVVQRICNESPIDNLAELYTNWSRAVYIDPEMDISGPVEISVVKLSEIEHTERSIEPMTLWRRNSKGPNKNCSTPKKHSVEESLWRHFGIIAMARASDGETKQPGILGQYQRLAESAGSRWTDLVGVSMEDDGNATSRLPVDEITDSFRINDLVITDTNDDGWVIRINDAVETTKDVVSGVFTSYLKGICEIRNLKLKDPIDPYAKGFIEEETKIMYSIIDPYFKEWLSQISPNDSKEAKIIEWYSQLRKMVLDRGEELFENSTSRDLIGIETKTRMENIATKYWQFVNRVNKRLKKRKEG